MDEEYRQHLQSLLKAYRSRLYELEKQEAAQGIHVLPQVPVEIRELRAKIAGVEKEHRELYLQSLYQQLGKLRGEGQWQAMLNGLNELDRQQPGYPDPQGLRRWAERRQSRENYYRAALVAYDHGEWTRAITALEALLQATPGDVEAQALLSKARIKQRNAKFATAFLKSGKAVLLFLSNSHLRWPVLGIIVVFLVIGLVWSRSKAGTTGPTLTPTTQEVGNLINVDKPTSVIPVDIKAILKGYIAFESKRDGNSEIYVMDASGDQENLTKNPAGDYQPAWSPDGQHIAFISDRDRNGVDPDGNPYTEVYVMNADGSQPIRLTDTPVREGTPSWSRDGRYIAFLSYRDDGIHPEIYVMNADGTDQKRLTYDQSWDRSPTWSPNGRIAFASYRGDKWGVYVMNADGNDQRLLKEAPAGDLESRYPTWSPDGNRIAFALQRRDSENSEIYVMNADGSKSTSLSSSNAFDQWPTWSPDSQYIAFMSNRNGNWDIYAMSIQGDQPIRLTTDPAPDANPTWSPSQN